MTFPNWVCRDCGRTFGRKWNALRHINNCHNRNGAVVSFMDYVVGTHAGIYFPQSRPTYEPKKKNIFDIYSDNWQEEFWKEMARRNVSNIFNSMPGALWQKKNNNNLEHTSSFIWPDSTPVNFNQILGYTAFVCHKCLYSIIDEIFSPLTEEVKAKIGKHICDPKKVADNNQIDDTVRASCINALENHLPFLIKEAVNKWTKGQNYLIAIKISDIPENYIELTPSNEEHWAARAIINNQTLLKGIELIDFLQEVRNTTFAVFKINLHRSAGFYMLMIADSLANFKL
jgi:hypothetical protein